MKDIKIGDLVKEQNEPFLSTNEYKVIALYNSNKCLVQSIHPDNDNYTWTFEVDLNCLIRIEQIL